MSRLDPIFSKRTGWDLRASEFSLAITRARAGRSDVLDLTVSNATLCELEYDLEAVLGPFEDRRLMQQSLTYDPDPRGMRSAREAVAAYYADHNCNVDLDSLVITASTSEAYSYLFRLLCDGCDEVLVAQPSYPLFEFLADLDDVILKPYPLFYDFGWWIDFAELERRVGPRTRAVLVVHPNNPTGHWTHRAERERLEALCAMHGLALIVDEVFLDYPLAEPAAVSFAAGPHPVLTFVLSGISKICALPQMKVAWIASLGPERLVAETIARLDVVADTFLSMNAPAQLALPVWLQGREHMQRQIARRTRDNLQALEGAVGLQMLKVEAGWSAVLHTAAPPLAAERLLGEAGIIVHPGSFYGMADPRIIVVSLLTPTRLLEEALERLGGIMRDGNA